MGLTAVLVVIVIFAVIGLVTYSSITLANDQFEGTVDPPVPMGCPFGQIPTGIADTCVDLTGDIDDDGIINVSDLCIIEPENYNGYLDTDGCPDTVPIIPQPGDRDNDGIADIVDLCPETPETINGYLDGDGCPDADPNQMPDTDLDNIPDSLDQCKFQPETLNGYLDADGCPDTIPVLTVDCVDPFGNIIACPDDTLPPPLTDREEFYQNTIYTVNQVIQNYKILRNTDDSFIMKGKFLQTSGPFVAVGCFQYDPGTEPPVENFDVYVGPKWEQKVQYFFQDGADSSRKIMVEGRDVFGNLVYKPTNGYNSVTGDQTNLIISGFTEYYVYGKLIGFDGVQGPCPPADTYDQLIFQVQEGTLWGISLQSLLGPVYLWG